MPQAMAIRALGAFAAVTLLLLLTMPVAHAAFPGRNGKIAYTSSHSSISSVAPDGSNRTLLIQANGIGGPEWSPDGSRIAFEESGIWIMNADGSGTTRITSSGLDREPTWSPDGRRIAFASFRTGTIALWVVNADGSAARLLADPPIIGDQPAWSPDGTKIAYVGFTRVAGSPHVNQDIYTVNADGTGVTNLTAGIGQELTPEWAPDGSRIAFGSDLETRFDATNLYTVRPDGTDLTRLTFSTNNVHEFGPAWSPDGRRIAYVNTTYDPPGEADAGEDIDIINADGTGAPVRVTPANDNVHNNEPDWQPLGPQPSDFKNRSQFCKAEREFLGDETFRQRYGGNANAYGTCVSGK